MLSATEQRLLSDPSFIARMTEAAAQPTEDLELEDLSPLLALETTAEAKAGLRSLRAANTDLFDVVSERITAVRREPGRRKRGHSFRLGDGRTARLAASFDIVAQKELVVVWLVEEHGGEGVLHVIAVEHTA